MVRRKCGDQQEDPKHGCTLLFTADGSCTMNSELDRNVGSAPVPGNASKLIE